MLHEQTPFSVLFCFSASCSFVLTVHYLSQARELKARAWMDLRGFLNRTPGPNGAGGGLHLSFCVCSRDLQELNPPEREKAVLQYASWGPQGNQMVSQPLIHLSDRYVFFVICFNYTY